MCNKGVLFRNFKVWEALFTRYWQVTIFKESPENTPCSSLLLWIASFLFFLLIVLQWYLADMKQEYEMPTLFLAGLSLLCSYFVYTYFLLRIYRKAHRVLQTLTTLLLSQVIIRCFAFPLLTIAPKLASAGLDQGILLLISILYLIFTLLLTAWQFMVIIHIYKYALEADNMTAVLASFGLLACNILTISFWQ
jgi:lipid-A-disaccharide synthase-like uncharacterized protein